MEQGTETHSGLTASYSPDDNKLRLYSTSRLDSETYAQVKAAGFRWAPKQELFVAPMWTPDREDLLIELAGEIEDEDKSLVDRQEERAERFEDYSEKRARDADRAREAVDRIADGIPMGQPILVGHHSERHARRDAKKIENGMRKAINLWETSKYWTSRAAGALRHAKYKERPDVRARRIKTIEADKRKQERNKQRAEFYINLWKDPTARIHKPVKVSLNGVEATIREDVSLRAAVVFLANRDGGYYASSHTYSSGYIGPISLWEAAGGNIDKEDPDARAIATPEEICARAIQNHESTIARAVRWIAHYENRLAYERAMLDEQGRSDLLKPKPRSAAAQLPLCNYRQATISTPNRYRGEMMTLPQVEMTAKEYADIHSDYKGTRVVDNSHRVRSAVVKSHLVCVFLTDSKVHKKPEPITPPERPLPDPPAAKQAPEPKPHRHAQSNGDCFCSRPEHLPAANPFEQMKDTLKAGIQVVSAPQLFPTPPEIAERMVELAEIERGQRILEPSAGTGNLVTAIWEERGERCNVAIEINPELCRLLTPRVPSVRCADFLECVDEEKFDRIIMNPPFENGADIKHIKHALTMLKPGGRLVALCANGPRQQDALKPLADDWETLPAGSFKTQGTNVNVALCVFTREPEPEPLPAPRTTTKEEIAECPRPVSQPTDVQPRLF